MAERTEQKSDNQAAQREKVKQARALPGVADVVDLYGRLGAYSQFVNVQPSQTCNATGGNVMNDPSEAPQSERLERAVETVRREHPDLEKQPDAQRPGRNGNPLAPVVGWMPEADPMASTSWIASVHQRLDELAALAPGWDDSNGAAIGPAWIKNARDLISSEMVTSVAAKPDLVPTCDGGLLVEWHTEAIDLIIELAPAGASCYACDNETNSEVEGALGEQIEHVTSALAKLGLKRQLQHQDKRRNHTRDWVPQLHALAAWRRVGIRAAKGGRACGPSGAIPPHG